jgi:hypothetical protein
MVSSTGAEAMYLPNSLYERAPHYWLFIGMLLVVLGIYLGIEMSIPFLYGLARFRIMRLGRAYPYASFTPIGRFRHHRVRSV